MMMRLLLAVVATLALTTACAPKPAQKPVKVEPKLLTEKNSTDIYAIPLDESDVEDQEEIKTLEKIGDKNEKKAEAKTAATKAAPKK